MAACCCEQRGNLVFTQMLLFSQLFCSFTTDFDSSETVFQYVAAATLCLWR